MEIRKPTYASECGQAKRAPLNTSTAVQLTIVPTRTYSYNHVAYVNVSYSYDMYVYVYVYVYAYGYKPRRRQFSHLCNAPGKERVNVCNKFDSKG